MVYNLKTRTLSELLGHGIANDEQRYTDLVGEMNESKMKGDIEEKKRNHARALSKSRAEGFQIRPNINWKFRA